MSTLNVVPLGKSIVNEELVEALEKMLERARSGEIDAMIFCATQTKEGGVVTAFCRGDNTNVFTLYGAHQRAGDRFKQTFFEYGE